MVEHVAGRLAEVARTADQCAGAVRLAAYGKLDEVLRGSPHRAELLALWARLLVTITPDELAAEMVDELLRRDLSDWLAAVQYFVDYSDRRGPDRLDRFVAEVLSWPWALQMPLARIMLTTIAKSLPRGILPSHYLVARGMVTEAADQVGCPGLTPAVTGLIARGWRDADVPAIRRACDLTHHVDLELPDGRSRRQAAAALAIVVAHGWKHGPGTDSGMAPSVAARVVQHAASGSLHKIETELREEVHGECELVSVLLALTMAAAAHVREEVCHGLG